LNYPQEPYFQILAAALRGEKMWEMMQILEEADIQGVSDLFWRIHREEYYKRVKLIDAEVQELRAKRLWIPRTKIKPGYDMIDTRTLSGLKKLEILDVLELRALVHVKLDSSQLSDVTSETDSTLGADPINSLISVSYWAQGVFEIFGSLKYGLIFKVKNSDVIFGSKINLFSGQKKAFPKLLEYIFKKEKFSQHLKKQLGIQSEKELLVFMDEITKYEDLTEIPDLKEFQFGEEKVLGKDLKKIFLNIIEDVFLNLKNYNEFLAMTPQTAGIFYILNNDKEKVQLPENFDQLAREMNIPIIILRKNDEILRQIILKILNLLRGEQFKDLSFKSLYSLKCSA